MADPRTIMIKIAADGRVAAAEIDGVQGKLKTMQTSASSATSSLMKVAGSAAAFASLAVVVKSSADAMTQMERATIGLAVTARFVGEDLNKVNQAARALSADGLMSVVDASQAIQNLLSRGYTLEQTIQLMNRLKDSAAFNRQSHLEFGQAIVGATEGLKNENSVLVDNAGVTKNVSMMWKEYAAEHGKSVDSLTQAEKRMAEYNGILRETEGQVGNAARMTDTFQGAQAKLNQEVFTAKAAFGQALAPALTGLLNVATPLVGLLGKMVWLLETLAADALNAAENIGVFFRYATPGTRTGKSSGPLDVIPGFKLARNYKAYRDEVNANTAMTEGFITERAAFWAGDLTTNPDIGADTGKRRKDTVLAGKPAKGAKAPAGGTSKNWSAQYTREAEAVLAAEERFNITFADMTMGATAKKMAQLERERRNHQDDWAMRATTEEEYQSRMVKIGEWYAAARLQVANEHAAQISEAEERRREDELRAAENHQQRLMDVKRLEQDIAINTAYNKDDRYSAQMMQLQQGLEDRKRMIDEFRQQEVIDEEQKNSLLLAANREYAAQKSAIDKNQRDKAVASLGNTMTSLGNTLMQGNKDQFEIGKGLAIAGAVIDTYRAATGAFAAMASIPYVGPALGAAAAAAAVASGMAQVAVIESTKYNARRETGGQVSTGSTYLVGERGPELLTMGQGGYITPNNKMASRGEGVKVTNVYQISTGVADTVRAEIMKAVPSITGHSLAAVHRAINSGTKLSSAVGRM